MPWLPTRPTTKSRSCEQVVRRKVAAAVAWFEVGGWRCKIHTATIAQGWHQH